jgi:signal transduction histidine kinase
MLNASRRRTLLIPIAFELSFSMLVGAAYLSLFRVPPDGRGRMIAVIAVVMALKIAIVVVLLQVKLTPLREWHAAAHPDDPLRRRALEAALRLPARLAVVWAVAWGLALVPVTLALERLLPSSVWLGDSARIATALMSLALMAGALPFTYLLLDWMVSGEAEELLLHVPEIGALAFRGPSLRTRLAVLSLCMALGPTAWLAAVAYEDEVRHTAHRVEDRSRLVAGELAVDMEREEARGVWPDRERLGAMVEARRGQGAQPFVATRSGDIVAGHEARDSLGDTPAMSRWLHRAAPVEEEGASSDPAGGYAIAFERVDRQRVAGAIARNWRSVPPTAARRLWLFGVVPLLWAPLCAAFLALAVSRPLTRMSHRVGWMARQRASGPQIPISSADELGDLAQSVNQLMALQEERERTAHFRELFIGVVGHDLRSPLAALKTGAKYLLQAGTSEPHARLLARMAHAADRMERMIDQLLDLTRSRLGGGIAVERHPMDLGELCARAIEEIEIAHPARAVRLEAAEAGCLGTWDRDRLGQVVSNLLINAIQHGSHDRPIDVHVHGLGATVLLEVHNWNSPIPAEQLPTLFDPFARAGAPSHVRGGLGLGLYISQQIVEAHRGTIEVESTWETGTTFRVSLPRG